MTQEDAEKSLILKREIEMIDTVIQDIRNQGIPKSQKSEKEYILQNVESFLQKLKTKSKVKNESEAAAGSKNADKEEEEFSHKSSINYMENVDMMLQVFIKRMEQAQKK